MTTFHVSKQGKRAKPVLSGQLLTPNNSSINLIATLGVNHRLYKLDPGISQYSIVDLFDKKYSASKAGTTEEGVSTRNRKQNQFSRVQNRVRAPKLVLKPVTQF